MSSPDLHAVGTGDVVGSSDLSASQRRRLPDRLRSAYATVQSADPGALPYDLAIIGGDGWQCYVESPADSLPRLLHFWSLLRAKEISCRMAIAIDTIDFISGGNVNESDGRAFRQSGRTLEDLRGTERLAFGLPDAAPPVYDLAIESMCELIDHLFHQWTAAQAQAVAGMMTSVGTDHSVTQQRIADEWSPRPVTRQTVNRHLKRAHWDRVERTLSRFNRLIGLLPDVRSSHG